MTQSVYRCVVGHVDGFELTGVPEVTAHLAANPLHLVVAVIKP